MTDRARGKATRIFDWYYKNKRNIKAFLKGLRVPVLIYGWAFGTLWAIASRSNIGLGISLGIMYAFGIGLMGWASMKEPKP